MSEWEQIETVVGPAQLRRSRRKTLAISVHPDGSLELAAPENARVEDILEKVARRETWIGRQRRTFAAMNATRATPRFCSGATHRYLGRQYRLKVELGKPPGVKLVGGYFHVTTERDSEVEVAELLRVWMRKQATEQFNRRVETWRGWCNRHQLAAPRPILRTMRKRWGSAHSDGRIALNPELVRAPSICIDYVIVHEICHLKYPNHGPQFFRLLGQLMPNWRNVKTRLEHVEL